MQDLDEPRRRSLRLAGYDYAQEGAYFVTVCTHQRESVLGVIVDERMRLSTIGQIVCERWEDLPNHHHVELDAFVVMPNHVQV